jgi:predicted amidohydrolase
MKIGVAQTQPLRGDIKPNIDYHKKLIQLAISHEADLIIFPELSLTGYEPTLAKSLAVNIDDDRLNTFQEISDASNISIGIGMPVKNKGGVSIAMVIFQPGNARQVYFKKYLHADEGDFFVSGENLTTVKIKDTTISLAICYEISILEHRDQACRTGDGLYIASVAKSVKGIDKALSTLSETAKKYSTIVMMSNCIGICDGEECAGKSSIWNNKGELIGQLDGKHEGMLIFNTQTGESTSQFQI